MIIPNSAMRTATTPVSWINQGVTQSGGGIGRRWEVEIQKSDLTEARVNPMAGTRLSPKSTTYRFESCPDYLNKKYMKEYKWGRLMISNQIGLMVSWGESVIPNRKYISLEIPFLIIQIYI